MGAARGGAPRRRRSPGGPRPAAPSCARWRPSWPAAWSSCRRPASATRRDRRRRRRRCVCPFKGLASFEVADAPYFFGRERLVAELVARLVGAPLLGVVGPSGSGKSSVLRAGLLPALAGGVLPGSERLDAGRSSGRASTRCASSRALARASTDRAVVLAVDQFEETFTACRDEDERARVRRRARARRRDRGGRASSCSRSAPTSTGAAPPTRSSRGLLAANHVLVGRDAARRAAPGRRAPRASAPACASSPSSSTRSWPTSRASPARCRCCRPRCSSSGSGATGGACASRPTSAPAACAARSRGSPRTRSPGSTAAQQAVARSVLAAAGRRGRRRRRSSAGGRRWPSSRRARRRRRPGRRAAHRPAPADGQRRDGRARPRGAAARVAAAARLDRGGPRRAAHPPRPRPPPRASGTRLDRDDGALYRGARLAEALEWRDAHDAGAERARARVPRRQRRAPPRASARTGAAGSAPRSRACSSALAAITAVAIVALYRARGRPRARHRGVARAGGEGASVPRRRSRACARDRAARRSAGRTPSRRGTCCARRRSRRGRGPSWPAHDGCTSVAPSPDGRRLVTARARPRRARLEPRERAAPVDGQGPPRLGARSEPVSRRAAGRERRGGRRRRHLGRGNRREARAASGARRSAPTGVDFSPDGDRLHRSHFSTAPIGLSRRRRDPCRCCAGTRVGLGGAVQPGRNAGRQRRRRRSAASGISRPAPRPCSTIPAVYSADFSPDGRRVATAAADGVVRIWDAAGVDVRDHPRPTTRRWSRCTSARTAAGS